MRKHFKSRFPAFNIPWRSEEVAIDNVFLDTPGIYYCVTMAQIFVGKRTLSLMSTPSNPEIYGAMTKLISDCAKVEISNKVKDILRVYHSSRWNSEPYTKSRIKQRGGTAPSKVGPIPS